MMTYLNHHGVRAVTAFFVLELRRHLGIVFFGWAVLFVPPLAHRFIEGHWSFYTGEWNDLAARFSCALLAPTLAAMMAISGWALEKEEGTLEWLYSRPLPSGRLVAARTGAILLSILVWIAGCLMLYRISPSDVGRWGSPLELFGILGFILFGVGSGLLAAALSSNRTQAAVGWFLGSLVFGSVAFKMWNLALPTRGVLWLGWDVLAPRAHGIYWGILAFGCLLVAAGSMLRAPSETHRWRGLAGIALFLLLALAGSLSVLLQPLRVEADGLAAVRDLGESVQLEMVQAKDLESGVYHPVIRGPAGTRIHHRAFVRGERIFAHAGSGRALLRDAAWTHHHAIGTDSRWIVIDREGGIRRVFLNEGTYQDPLGWSIDGRRFAWRTLHGNRRAQQGYVAVHLLIIEDDLPVRILRIPDLPRSNPNPWTAAWIGDEQLLVTTEPMLYSMVTRYAPRTSAKAWWMVIDSQGRRLTGPHDLSAPGQRLFSPALSFHPEGLSVPGNTFSPSPVSRIGEISYFLLASNTEGRIAGIDAAGWELVLGAESGWDSSLFLTGPIERLSIVHGHVSIGVLDESTLVWAARVAFGETAVYAVAARGGEPRRSCVFEHDAAGIGGFRGAHDGWAMWADGREQSLYACHVATGSTRRLADLGPLGARSVDVTGKGILTLDGWIELAAPSEMDLEPSSPGLSLFFAQGHRRIDAGRPPGR